MTTTFFFVSAYFLSAILVISITAIFLAKILSFAKKPVKKTVQKTISETKKIAGSQSKTINLDLLGEAIQGLGEFLGECYDDDKRFSVPSVRQKLGQQSALIIEKTKSIAK